MLLRIIFVLVWCGFASPTMAQVWPTPSTSILRRIFYDASPTDAAVLGVAIHIYR